MNTQKILRELSEEQVLIFTTSTKANSSGELNFFSPIPINGIIEKIVIINPNDGIQGPEFDFTVSGTGEFLAIDTTSASTVGVQYLFTYANDKNGNTGSPWSAVNPVMNAPMQVSGLFGSQGDSAPTIHVYYH